MPAITVAVVIPTLNEVSAIGSQLPALAGGVDELVVSDGGSVDGTVETATQLGARCVSGSKGRGPQMNRGAELTSSEVLVFLHADTRLPTGAIDAIRVSIEGGSVGGGFLARFDDRRPLFRIGSGLVNLRTRLTQAPLGDQAQFVQRQVFDRMDGFRDWPILEDLDFMRRLRRQGKIAIIDRRVVTSARRYIQNGITRTIANNWLIWLLYLLGASPQRLAARYRDVR